MVLISDRVMFEIYRESDFNKDFRVVYYTELHESNKEFEINRALSGIHVYDGFFRGSSAIEAKITISDVIARLNNGENLDEDSIDSILSPYKPGN